MPTLLLGISSGIAAFKMLDLIQLLQKQNVDVHVVMTKSAAHMVDQKEVEEISTHKVWTDLYEKNFDYKKVLETRKVDHIEVADSADLMVIAPATANTIAKLANGIADDFLTTTALAVACPIILFPSMNVHMWHHPSVQANLQKLRSYGYVVIDPDSGPLACGYEGKGRLPDVHAVLEVILEALHKKTLLQGKKVVVTFGGTQERIDQVRYITNRSSGKMGAAIADACFLAGAQVIVLRAKTAVQSRFSHKEEIFETADDLEQLVKKHSPETDILFHVAAVSDFKVETSLVAKIPSDKAIHLDLAPRLKIVHQIKKWNPDIKLIAFKAEAGISETELIQKAQNKIREEDADVIVANDVGKNDRGFQSEENEVIVIKKDASQHKIHLAPKTEIAQQLIAYLFQKK
jgi:phosphopantothenoylcysteine decarboxylase/phosphopantothenate--cysteine ligase